MVAERVAALKLRDWQEKARAKSGQAFASGHNFFLVVAGTGTGKTMAALAMAGRLIAAGEIDGVVVVAPTVEVVENWAKTAGTLLGIGASSSAAIQDDVSLYAVTYAWLCQARESDLHLIMSRRRVLLIIDEIHHAERQAAYGEAVDRLFRLSHKALALSGTPWNEGGQVALLDGFYVPAEEEAGVAMRLDTDRPNAIWHSYADDLNEKGDNRGTVPVKFDLFEVVGKYRRKLSTAVEDLLGEPDIRRIHYRRPDSDPEWIALANPRCKEAMTPHLQVEDNRLSNNQMMRAMLDQGIHRLQLSRSETGQKIMALVVAPNIKSAHQIGEYLESRDQSVDVITSKKDDGGIDAGAAARLAALRDGTAAVDFVVSVGMVAEGVDIPRLKVLVYLSPITTLLFLIQVIGRILRRIKSKTVSEHQQYIDKRPGEVVGYAIMPAHPFLLHVAWEIERDARIVLEAWEKEPRGPRDPGPGDQRITYEAETASYHTAYAYRGRLIPEELRRTLATLSEHPDACKVVTPNFKSWLDEQCSSGNTEWALTCVRELAIRFNVAIPSKPAGDVPDFDLTLDQQKALARSELKRLCSSIRHEVIRESIPDDKAYSKVNQYLNKCCGVARRENATLVQLNYMERLAKELLRMEPEEALRWVMSGARPGVSDAA
jgi:superfamily II DNA or RNA helicase